jgi:hypothetical protein
MEREFEMNKKFLALCLAALLVPVGAFAYQVQKGDPDTAGIKEFRPVKKSAVAGVSDAILAAGELLSYSAAADGNTVTRVGDGTVLKGGLIACAAKEAIATGDTAYHLCQTRGYATVKYDATSLEWDDGESLCVNSVGAAVNCAAAGSKTGVIALEAKARGTSGSDLKVMLKLD